MRILLLFLCSIPIAAQELPRSPVLFFYQPVDFFRTMGIAPTWDGDRITICADQSSASPLMARATWDGSDGSGREFQALLQPGKCEVRELGESARPVLPLGGNIRVFWQESKGGVVNVDKWVEAKYPY